jgi:uncharacterized protein YbjT (DUF2867 family)
MAPSIDSAAGIQRHSPGMTGPVLVFGATGTQGGAVARALLASGVAVRAFVRDQGSPRAQSLAEAGAELVLGDLREEPTVIDAMASVAAAYAITTPFEDGPEGEERQGRLLIASAVAARLPWLILASVAAAARADVPHFTSKARLEQALTQTALDWTVVAPSYFFENVVGSRDAIRAGRLELALPGDTPLHQVALENLGAVVAEVVRRKDEHLGVRVEIAGDAPTPRAMAEALGASFQELPIATVRQRSSDLAAMFEFLAREGYGIDVSAVRARYPEVAWQSFARWAGSIDWTSPT